MLELFKRGIGFGSCLPADWCKSRIEAGTKARHALRVNVLTSEEKTVRMVEQAMAVMVSDGLEEGGKVLAIQE